MSSRAPVSWLVDLGLIAFASILFALSFPGFASTQGWFPLAWICLVPLFVVVRRAPWPVVPFYGLAFGYLSYVLFNYWLGRFHPLTLVVVPPIYAAYFLLVLPALKLADTLFPVYGCLLQAALWVCYEYFLKSSGFLAYSYGNLGYSQWQFLPLVRSASLWGVWGVSALVVFPSALLGSSLATDGASGRRGPGMAHAPTLAGGLRGAPAALRARIVPAAVWAVVLAGAIGWGVVTKVDLAWVRQWKVALVQQNIDPWKGGYRAYEESLRRLVRQSNRALAEGPEIVIWSETSFVPAIDWHTRYRTDLQVYGLVRQLREYLAAQPVPFVVGNDDGELAWTAAGEQRVDYNASILFDHGEIVDTYRKLHLVPFTESFPFQKTLPRIYAWLEAADTHFWRQGDRWTVFEAGGVRFSTPICFEDTFGDLCRGFFQRGADVLVNMTNDAWSHSVPGAMQHMTMAVFRAAEARRPVVRSTNAGITCIIDPNGRILASLPAFSEDTLVGEVPVYREGTTPYLRWGDWLPLVLAAAALLALVAGLARAWSRLTPRANRGTMRP